MIDLRQRAMKTDDDDDGALLWPTAPRSPRSTSTIVLVPVPVPIVLLPVVLGPSTTVARDSDRLVHTNLYLVGSFLVLASTSTSTGTAVYTC
jgi:hypothetical protein